MKIVCDSCQAKYSISDDKVQGKVFKIRCKKCSNIIVVRGGQSAVEPAPAPAPEKDTRVYDYGYDGGGGAPAGDESVWHVVINQDQVGPMTAAEVQQRFASGDIDADTYIWREGFGDWLPISQVDTFAEYVASGSTTAAVSSRAGQDAVSAMFGGGGGGGDESGTVRSDPGDLFAAASSGSARHQAASVPAEDDGDLFGSKPASASASAQVSAKGGGDKLRGERNENSVLFSLGNLAQLASDKPAPVTAAPSSGGHATGAAGGEGSGLIDIRSMANAYLGGGGAGMAAKPATSSAIGSMDDLPVFGGGGFSEPAVMMPTASRQNNSKLMVALIGSVAALAVAAVILVVVLVGGDDKKQVAASADDKTAVGDKAAAGTDDGESGKSGDDKPAASGEGSAASGDGDKPAAPSDPGGASAKDPEPAQVAAKDPEEKPATVAKPEKTVKPNKPERTASRPDPKPEKPAAPKPEKPAKAESGGGGCDEVGCVISGYEGACCAKYKKGGGSKPAAAAAGGGKSDLPSSLDRSAISEGVAKVKGRVMACGDKSSAKGQVKVSVKVTADGNVSSVSVKESPDSSLGSCVANAMQKASFKKTQSGGSFSYPFVF